MQQQENTPLQQKDFLTGIMILKPVTDHNRNIVDFVWELVCPGSEEIVGRTDLENKRLLEELPGNYTKDLYEIYKSVVETGEPLFISHSYEHEEGKHWYEIHAIKWRDKVVVNCNNVTGIRNTQHQLTKLNAELEKKVKDRTKELEQSKQLLRLIVDSLPVLIYYLDREFKIKFYNETHSTWFGDIDQEILGQAFTTVLAGTNLENISQHLQEALTGEVVWVDHDITIREGRTLYVKTALAPERDKDGKVLGLVITVVDVTEEKKLKEKAYQAKQGLTAVLSNVPVFLWAVNTKGIITMAEGKGAEVLGLPADELVGQSAFILFQDFPYVVKNLEKSLNGSTFSEIIRVKEFTFQNYYYPTRNSEGEITGIGGISTDITERIKAEEELAASEAKYRAMAEGIPQMVWTAKPNGDTGYFNQNWYRYTGISPDKKISDVWKKALHPDDYLAAIEQWEQSARTGQEFEQELRYQRAADGSYRWHLVRAWPVRNAKGVIIKWLGTSTDIHDQKEKSNELKQKNHELLKTNNDLDNFIYTASHDLRSPISNIEGLLTAIESELDGECSEAIEAMIHMTNFSVNRLKETISDLTEISKIQRNYTEDVEEINIPQVLEEFLIEHRDQIDSTNAFIDLHLTTKDIKFSRRNFRSIIYNLLSNAIKYRHPDRPPVITIKNRSYGENCMVMTVSDNGIGMDVNQKSKIFGMFKRLHTHVEGTGIGLYIVKRVMENSGGKIDVLSEPDKGSTFKLLFQMQ